MKLARMSIGIFNIIVAISQLPFSFITTFMLDVTNGIYLHILAILALFISGILILKNIQIGWILSISLLLLYLFLSIYQIIILFPRDGMFLLMPNTTFYILFPPNSFVLVLVLFIVQLTVNIKLNLRVNSN